MTSSEVKQLPTLSRGEQIGDRLWTGVGPVIFLVGFVGNILILVVMNQPRMRGTSTSVYLRWMAAADLAFLLTDIIPEWLRASRIVTLEDAFSTLCKLEKFCSYTSSDTSIWILVTFTLDRFVAVCFPLRRNTTVFQPRRAKYFAVGALITAVLKNFHVFWTRGPEYHERLGINGTSELILVKVCGRPTAEFRHFDAFIRPYIVFAVVNALPFCIIVVCNVFIVRELIRMRRERQAMTEVSLPSRSTAVADDNVTQMTALCLSASFCFLVCVTPAMALLIGRTYWDDPPSDSYAIAYAVCNQIFCVNHSLNFWLYCMTGKRFRATLNSTLCCTDVAPLAALRRWLANHRSPLTASAASEAVPFPQQPGPSDEGIFSVSVTEPTTTATVKSDSQQLTTSTAASRDISDSQSTASTTFTSQGPDSSASRPRSEPTTSIPGVLKSRPCLMVSTSVGSAPVRPPRRPTAASRAAQSTPSTRDAEQRTRAREQRTELVISASAILHLPTRPPRRSRPRR